MKQDEFAFFNQQLAGMLQAGIPLEGALKQLCSTMRHGATRNQFQKLQSDLLQGKPLEQSLQSSELPEFYRQMVRVGAQTNDLPGMLLLLADYYQKLSLLQTRLKGVLVYPLIVLFSALGLSIFLSLLYGRIIREMAVGDVFAIPPMLFFSLWLPPLLLTAISVAALFSIFHPRIRRFLRWRIPALRDANLSQLASAAGLILRRGSDMGSVFKLLRQLEALTPAEHEIAIWEKRLGEGHAKFSDMATEKKTFPPLFFWLVENSGSDIAGGFMKAAEVYGNRAAYRADMLLFAALPVSVLILGMMLVLQVAPFMQMMKVAFTSMTSE